MRLAGATSTGYTGAVEAYDPVHGFWTTSPSMPTRRYALAAASLGNKIYAVGGVSPANDPLATVEYLPVQSGASGYSITESSAPTFYFANRLLTQCDDCTKSVSPPFPLEFYGKSYTSAFVSSNGRLPTAPP
jgi:Kelch motif.